MVFSRITSVIISSFIIIMAACSGDSGEGKENGDNSAVSDTLTTYSLKLQSGFAEINGAKIYYEIAGEGTPLVMLHAVSPIAVCGENRWSISRDITKS